MIGPLVGVDLNTRAKKGDMQVARFCVTVDIKNLLVSKVVIKNNKDYMQNIEYGYIPTECGVCKQHGYNIKDCVNRMTTQNLNPKTNFDRNKINPSQ